MEKFGPDNTGCYADACFGHDHIRERLADLCEEYGNDALADVLRESMSDDASEEDDALEWLNETACENVRFELSDGDLMLFSEDEVWR